MTIDEISLILWIIAGILNLIGAAIDNDHKVPVLSFFCCWMLLIIKLMDAIMVK